MKTDINERLVTQAWQTLLSSGCEFQTEGGEPLKVVYPGKVSDAPGSDFQDAVITVDGQLIKGNIEVHVNSSDWQTHQHHRNSAYNGIILHVVMWHDSPVDTRLENGAKIPIVALHRYDNIGLHPSALRRAVPCSEIAKRSDNELPEKLDWAGEMRFYEKAAQFQTELKLCEAEQCLYRNIMCALGYARNKMPFLELAGRVPFSVLESIAKDNKTDKEKLLRQQALLMGSAGLLPSQRSGTIPDDPEVTALESWWQTSSHRETMSLLHWQVFRVRPSNSPVRRIAGMSYLLLRYREKGLLAGLLELVREAPPEKGHYLEAGLMVNNEDYWSNHFDFGRQCKGLTSLLIGQSRAADIVVNVLLPFAQAWGNITKQPEITKKAFSLYCSYPAISENTVEKHMRTQLGLKGAQVNSARRQQGLIHIYKRCCTQGRCEECPLSHASFIPGTTSSDRSLVLPA